MVPSYEIAVRIVPITDECNAGSGTEAGQLEGLNKVAFRRFPWIALERWDRYSTCLGFRNICCSAAGVMNRVVVIRFPSGANMEELCDGPLDLLR